MDNFKGCLGMMNFKKLFVQESRKKYRVCLKSEGVKLNCPKKEDMVKKFKI